MCIRWCVGRDIGGRVGGLSANKGGVKTGIQRDVNSVNGDVCLL